MMELFSLKGKNAVLLGGGGVLGTTMAKGLVAAGANIAICDLREENAQAVANDIAKEGILAKGYKLNAMEKEDINKVCELITGDFGRVDILVNAVGGNMKDATTSDTTNFFDLSGDALQKVLNLNLMGGAILPSQVFGKEMVKNEN